MNSIMGEYALLTEVYGTDYHKKPKKKKEKKQRNQIIEPDEMDRVLLNEESLSPEARVRNMKIDPYDNESLHQSLDNENPNIKQYQDYSPRATYDRQINRGIGQPSSYKDDPEYQEFLEYKKYKRTKSLENEMKIIESNRPVSTSYSANDQMNELLLYIFTGFFILMLFDNMYKMGKRSY